MEFNYTDFTAATVGSTNVMVIACENSKDNLKKKAFTDRVDASYRTTTCGYELKIRGHIEWQFLLYFKNFKNSRIQENSMHKKKQKKYNN